jgi:ATP-dependent Clp protease, protease subunit
VEKLFLRDRYMDAPEAKEYGLIDEILGKTSDIVRFENGLLRVVGESDKTEETPAETQAE